MNKNRQQAVEKLMGAIDAAAAKTARKSAKKKIVTRSPQEVKALMQSAPDRFFDYCQLMAPDFYRPDRPYLVELCNELQAFYEDTYQEVLIISIPPRHGKSRTACLFCQWVYGKNPSEKIMSGSYNEMLSATFSKNIRNTIQEEKLDPDKIVYSDIFPYTKIQPGDAAAHYWTVAGEYSSYLATSPTGTATGFGCSLMVIDDIIKNAYEANNENILDGHWEWFANTMLSRLEEGGKVIIIMTRWSSKDLAGRAAAFFGTRAKLITMKAVQSDGSMLCPVVLSRKSYDQKSAAMSPEIAAANYQQEPIDSKGRLYQRFKTYDRLPTDEKGNSLLEVIKNYTDTADEGSDYLCSINYGVYNGEAYIINVLYTKDPMEVTGPATAKMLYEDQVNDADIESNNGGRGFAREIERELRERYRSNRTVINPFFQNQNKKSRIISNSSWVQDHIYFPSNWHIRWPEYHRDMSTYQREGKNKHDDAPDCTTGIAEKITGGFGGAEFVNVVL